MPSLHARPPATDSLKCHRCPCFSLCPGNASTFIPSPGKAVRPSRPFPQQRPATQLSSASTWATLVSPGLTCHFPLLFCHQSQGQNPLNSRNFLPTVAWPLPVSSLFRSLAPHVRPGQTDQNGTACFYSSNLHRLHEAAAQPPCSAETVPGCPNHCPAPAAWPQVLTNCWMLKFMVPPLFRPSVRRAEQLNPFIVQPAGGGGRARQRPGPRPDNSVAL